MIALEGPGVWAPGPLRSARRRIEDQREIRRENSWPHALEAIGLIRERGAGRRELFLDAQGDGDAVGFTGPADATAGENLKHEVVGKATLIGPIDDASA